MIPPRTNNPTIPPKNDTRNPINTAFGAYGNTTGQSIAGLAFGTIFSAIPRNAGTISPMIKRTPLKMIYTPPAKLNPFVIAHTIQCVCVSPLKKAEIVGSLIPSLTTTATNVTTTKKIVIVKPIATVVSRKKEILCGKFTSSVDLLLSLNSFPICAENQ